MSTAVEQHRAQAPRIVRVAVLTISDTRTEDTDTSGDLIAELSQSAGFQVANRKIVLDDLHQIRAWVTDCRIQGNIDAVIMTGGTGISPRDQTLEAIDPLLTKFIPGFGELFRQLSYNEIGSATILSRAFAGLIDPMIVIALPGSRAGVELAMNQIVIPELAHLVQQATKL